MTPLPIGTVKRMTVLRKIDTGYVLEKEGQTALLHHRETKEELEENEEVDVFLYNDKKGNLAATAVIPKIQRGIYDWAEVTNAISGLGVFVHIGIGKEMLVSADDLPPFERVWPKPNDKLYVTLGLDRRGRLLAIPATEHEMNRLFSPAPPEMLYQPVSGRIFRTSREGSVMITEENYRGFIHHTERKEEPRLGELVHGRIIDVKENGTINVSLRPQKEKSMTDDAEAILRHLEKLNGVIPFDDRSDPEDIRATFGISKAAFKRALGKLMKEGKAEQRDGHTYLLEKKE